MIKNNKKVQKNKKKHIFRQNITFTAVKMIKLHIVI